MNAGVGARNAAHPMQCPLGGGGDAGREKRYSGT